MLLLVKKLLKACVLLLGLLKPNGTTSLNGVSDCYSDSFVIAKLSFFALLNR
jgi:hypothetical protein